MSASLYDPERISKISTIMPSLINLAQEGYEVMMGLEGDPMLNMSNPRKFGTISSIDHKADGEVLVTIKDSKTHDLTTYSSQSIKPLDLWEFTPSQVEKIIEQERKMAERSESSTKEDPAFRW